MMRSHQMDTRANLKGIHIDSTNRTCDTPCFEMGNKVIYYNLLHKIRTHESKLIINQYINK